MKALILRGKRKGEVIEVGQWCNDWFSDHDSTGIFSPTGLMFTSEGMDTIQNHKNNGTLFAEYRKRYYEGKEKVVAGQIYAWGFKRAPFVIPLPRVRA